MFFVHLNQLLWFIWWLVSSTKKNFLFLVCRHQLLTDDELGPLYDLLIDEPPLIRRAIGELVYDHLIAQKIKNSHSGRKGILLKLIMHCGIVNVNNQTYWSNNMSRWRE